MKRTLSWRMSTKEGIYAINTLLIYSCKILILKRSVNLRKKFRGGYEVSIKYGHKMFPTH
jgi:hypothetical protein